MRKQFSIPLILALSVWIGSEAILWQVCQYSGYEYLNPDTWLRWDSGHYIEIAESGYTYFPCEDEFDQAELKGLHCGNAGWFPGYSWLISVLNSYGISYAGAANFISRYCLILALYFLALCMNMKTYNLKNLAVIGIAGLCFGSVYYHAAFPISLLLCWTCLGLLAIHRDRLWLAFVSCLLAALSYSTGFLLAWVMAFYILSTRGRSLRQRVTQAMLPLAFGGLGVLAVFGLMEYELGSWTAFIDIQSKYGHGAQTPWKRIGKFVRRWDSEQWASTNYIIMQSLTVIVGYLLLLVYALRNKGLKDPLTRLAIIYLSIFLIFPWTVGGNLSIYRAESLLMPFALVVRHLKWPQLGVILIVEIGFAVVMSSYFLEGLLI